VAADWHEHTASNVVKLTTAPTITEFEFEFVSGIVYIRFVFSAEVLL